VSRGEGELLTVPKPRAVRLLSVYLAVMQSARSWGHLAKLHQLTAFFHLTRSLITCVYRKLKHGGW
jgi:hypothetical protein